MAMQGSLVERAMLWVKCLIGICLDLSAIAPVASTFQPTVLRPDPSPPFQAHLPFLGHRNPAGKSVHYPTILKLCDVLGNMLKFTGRA